MRQARLHCYLCQDIDTNCVAMRLAWLAGGSCCDTAYQYGNGRQNRCFKPCSHALHRSITHTNASPVTKPRGIATSMIAASQQPLCAPLPTGWSRGPLEIVASGPTERSRTAAK